MTAGCGAVGAWSVQWMLSQKDLWLPLGCWLGTSVMDNSQTSIGRGIMTAGPHLPQSSHSPSVDSSFDGAIENKGPGLGWGVTFLTTVKSKEVVI